ncbi:histidine kinase [Sphingobium yanoikuyae]|uniref:sensor histidine kinase n=1 Tax=Sphingobium yanoikuyae TaxID=13690 RepID=UPI001F45103B|nr:histidine kinase [Sphingobium yanoikuyae]MDG2514265.1 histidine kinase [Sphingobium yanoikuyae]
MASRADLQRLINSIPVKIVVVDRDACIAAINGACQPYLRAVGLDLHLVAGQSYYAVKARFAAPPQDARSVSEHVAALCQHNTPFSQTLSFPLAGQDIRMVVHGERLPGTEDLFILSHLDDEDPESETANPRRYHLSMLQAEEEERKRIARELHDETAQQLALMQFNLMTLRNSDMSPQASDAYQAMETSLKAIQDQVRTLSYLLHPPELAEDGIEAALAHFTRGFGPGSRSNFAAFRDRSSATRTWKSPSIASRRKHWPMSTNMPMPATPSSACDGPRPASPWK